ncbi:MAG: SPFH domain-containing protein [Methylacidiphilales bacterium]|nr:SPFH domain-containing protein [Candidatus Methylacidiphilales bacterium]
MNNHFNTRGNAPVLTLAALAALFAFGALVWFGGSHNFYTPAGYVGYVTRGAVVGKTEYVGTQAGPTSTGLGWMLHGINISVTPYTYTEEFNGSESVLSKDQLKVAFRVHTIWNVRPDKVKEFVEKYSTLDAEDNPDKIVQVAYANFVRERLRTAARSEVQKFNAMEIKDNIDKIGEVLRGNILEMTKDTPFNVPSVVVGNIQYPESVSEAVSNKLAASQELETREIQIQIAKKDAEKRVAEAEGIAKAMTIVQQKLTPLYIQHEAIEAQKAMVGSPNHTTIYIPVGNNGVPLVGAVDASGK